MCPEKTGVSQAWGARYRSSRKKLTDQEVPFTETRQTRIGKDMGEGDREGAEKSHLVLFHAHPGHTRRKFSLRSTFVTLAYVAEVMDVDKII